MHTNTIRLAVALLVLAAPLAAAPALAAAANVSPAATYTGTAATGGTVEFDVSADGGAVTRFAVVGVPTSCGTVDSTSVGTIAISGDSFQSSSSSGFRFSGSFPAPQQARGTLSLKLIFPSCTSQEVAWTASTPTPQPPPPDVTAPQTKITSGPSGKTHSRKATFRFTSGEAGSTFQCKLDGKRWQSCSSPKKYSHLAVGKHTFRVRARDAAGNTDASPAKRSWRVETG